MIFIPLRILGKLEFIYIVNGRVFSMRMGQQGRKSGREGSISMWDSNVCARVSVCLPIFMALAA